MVLLVPVAIPFLVHDPRPVPRPLWRLITPGPVPVPVPISVSVAVAIPLAGRSVPLPVAALPVRGRVLPRGDLLGPAAVKAHVVGVLVLEDRLGRHGARGREAVGTGAAAYDARGRGDDDRVGLCAATALLVGVVVAVGLLLLASVRLIVPWCVPAAMCGTPATGLVVRGSVAIACVEERF